MTIENIRADGYVNRWSLLAAEGGGYEPRCLVDAVPVDHADARLAAARNQAIAEALQTGVGLTPQAVEGRAQALLASVALPVPEVITDRQFAQALALAMPDKITKEQALAWASRGDIPPSLLEMVDRFPGELAFAAKMKLAAAVEFRRDDPLVDVFASGLGVPAGDVDNLWRMAAAL